MNNAERKIRESFRLVKTDMLEMQRQITELSKEQEELLKIVSDFKDKVAKLEAEAKVLKSRQQKPVVQVVEKKIEKKVVSSAKKKPQVYVGAKNGKTIHIKTCPFAKKIMPKNKVEFKTKNTAFNLGYQACECMKRI